MSGTKVLFGMGLTLGLVLGTVGTVAWKAVAAENAPVASIAGDPASPSPSRAPGDAPAVREPAAGAIAKPGVPERPENAVPAGAAAAPEREAVELIGDALRAFAVAELRRGWSEVRGDTMPDAVLQDQLHEYESQVRTLPAAMGRSAAAEATVTERKADAFANADAVTLLGVFEGGDPELQGFVASERFGMLFAHRGGGSAVDGASYRQGEKLADGATLNFPAGVFALPDLSRGNEPFPAAVTVRGASMDATLLVVDSLNARSAVDRLAIEDCTVFAENGITDLRSKPGVLSLRRVRVVGFDCGAGGSCAFYLFGKSALLVTECRFEGGYGRAPGSYANLMDTRSLCLARFERCVFDRVSLSDAGNTVRFVGCEMRELLGTQPSGSVYENCRIAPIDPKKAWDAEYRKRDLEALFPQWRERLRR